MSGTLLCSHPIYHKDIKSSVEDVTGLTDWGLMAFSAQTGYIVPLKSMLQF